VGNFAQLMQPTAAGTKEKKYKKKVVGKKHKIRKIKRKFPPLFTTSFVFHLVYSFAGAHEN